MKKHLNTLYVTTQGAWLGMEGETVHVKIDGETRLRVPLHMLESIIVFGNISLSQYLMGRCAEHGISISYLTEWGRFLARVVGPVSGNVILRRTQYRWADEYEKSASISKVIIGAKIANSRSALQRTLRDHKNIQKRDNLTVTIRILQMRLEEMKKADDLDTLRGIEGLAAQEYFGALNYMIMNEDPAFTFTKRTRRPPLDPINALLSFMYTLLLHDVRSALESVGLDPQVGFLHRDRPGRPGLALDMMEEFRPFLADRLVLTLINRKQVSSGNFQKVETGGIYMDDSARKTVLTAYQERKKEEIKHPFLEEMTTIGGLIHIQALLMARYLRGDLDGYPPFFWK